MELMMEVAKEGTILLPSHLFHEMCMRITNQANRKVKMEAGKD